MRLAAKICRVCMWLVLLVCGFFQWCGIVGILINNSRSDEPYTVWPLIVAMVVLTVATLWFSLSPRHRLWGLIASGVASVVILVAALDLWQTFDAASVISGGITLGTLIWRHISCVLTFVFMLAAYLLDNAAPVPESDDGETPFSAILAQIDKEPSPKK